MSLHIQNGRNMADWRKGVTGCQTTVRASVPPWRCQCPEFEIALMLVPRQHPGPIKQHPKPTTTPNVAVQPYRQSHLTTLTSVPNPHLKPPRWPHRPTQPPNVMMPPYKQCQLLAKLPTWYSDHLCLQYQCCYIDSTPQ